MIRFKQRTRKVGILLISFAAFLWFLLFILSSDQEGLDLATQTINAALGSRKTTDFVTPLLPTILYQPNNIVLNYCKDDGSELFALFVVISSPENKDRRDFIRQGFVKSLEISNHGPEGGKWTKNKLIFFIGRTEEPNRQNKVLNEALLHEDILIENLHEDYLNLTLKTLRMLKWTQANCPNPKFLVKLDDDVHVNLPNLLTILHSVPEIEAGDFVGGHLYENPWIDEDHSSKWFTPAHLRPELKLPKFVGGFLYVLGRDAAKKIYAKSLEVSLFHLEDVFLTGMVASESLSLRLTNIPRIHLFWPRLWNFLTSSCQFLKLTAVHPAVIEDRSCWASFSAPHFECSIKPIYFC